MIKNYCDAILSQWDLLGRFAHKRTQLAVHSQGHEDQIGYAETFHFQSVRSTFFGKCTLII